MTESLFNQKQDDLPPVDTNKDYWAEYTQPGGKFHDPDESIAKKKIAFAKAESDRYVKHLERLLDESREDREKLDTEYKAGKSLSELIEELKTTRQPQQQHQDGNNQQPEVKNPGLQPEQFQTLFSQAYEQQQLLRKQQENMTSVQEKLNEKFGAQAPNVLRQQAKALGLSEERVNELAKESSIAFFKLMGLDDAKPDGDFTAPPRSTQRNDPFSPKSQLRDWAFYEKMRVENPKLYQNPKTHVQMHKDATDIDAQHGPGTFMRRK